jgi:hypothetical protein
MALKETCNQTNCQDAVKMLLESNDFGNKKDVVKRVIVGFLDAKMSAQCPDVLCCPLLEMEIWQVRLKEKDGKE